RSAQPGAPGPRRHRRGGRFLWPGRGDRGVTPDRWLRRRGGRHSRRGVLLVARGACRARLGIRRAISRRHGRGQLRPRRGPDRRCCASGSGSGL
ncbi:uncharacterized protein METZ01_LOCUS77925, partial [marine metagenome]